MIDFFCFLFILIEITMEQKVNNDRERQKNHRKFRERQGVTLFSFFQPVPLGFASSLRVQP
jgi:hypothetical protein